MGLRGEYPIGFPFIPDPWTLSCHSSHRVQFCGPPSHRPTATGVLGIKVHQIDNFALAPLYVYLFYQDVPVMASDESRK